MANLTKEQRLERESREHELREADPIHEEYEGNWDSDSLLDTTNIPARQGYVQRWVRTSIKGMEDQSNVFKKVNKGWKPRALSTIPKGQYVMRVDFNGVDVVGIHGMILMERPQALHDKQAKARQELNDLQMSAVKQNLYKVHDSSSGFSRPVMDERTSVSRGRIAPIDD